MECKPVETTCCIGTSRISLRTVLGALQVFGPYSSGYLTYPDRTCQNGKQAYIARNVSRPPSLIRKTNGQLVLVVERNFRADGGESVWIITSGFHWRSYS